MTFKVNCASLLDGQDRQEEFGEIKTGSKKCTSSLLLVNILQVTEYKETLMAIFG